MPESTTLHEQFRPRSWSEVIGQDKALARISALRRRGLPGRDFWISGASGTGKTTIAWLLAAEVADDYAIEELNTNDATAQRLREIERSEYMMRPIDRRVHALIANEAHGLQRDIIRKLLCMLDPVPSHILWALTTTSESQDKLFDNLDDAHPLLSRCVNLPLARRDLAKQFAAKAREIATAENLDGRPIGDYVKLSQRCRNNFRGMLQAVENGEMIGI